MKLFDFKGALLSTRRCLPIFYILHHVSLVECVWRLNAMEGLPELVDDRLASCHLFKAKF